MRQARTRCCVCQNESIFTRSEGIPLNIRMTEVARARAPSCCVPMIVTACEIVSTRWGKL